jgi:SulP family sulfate permease
LINPQIRWSSFSGTCLCDCPVVYPIPTVATLTHSESSPHRLTSNLIAGGTVGILIIIISVSFGAVIFSGELAEALPLGIGLLLFSSITVAAIVASFSSYPAIVAIPQDTTIPVLALVARHIIEEMPHDLPFEQRLYTVLATILLNSLIAGAIFLALGQFKLGGLIRFIPYPVVGGFLAGMGVLLIQGAFHSLGGIDAHHLKPYMLLKPYVFLQWFPGLIFALVMFFALKHLRHFLVVPGVISGAIALFYLGLAMTGTPIAEANAHGLLLGSIPAGGMFQLKTLPALTHADWKVVLHQFPDLSALWLIDAIALLLSASGIELIAAHDLDLNHELKVAGVASLVSGVGGGVGGFPILGETTMAHHLGGNSRLVGWTITGMCLAVLLGGGGALSFLPKMIVVGVPFLLGLELLDQWLYQSWFRVSRSDFAIIVLIVLAIATVGYIQGIAVGLVAATILFVINYSRLNVTKRVSSGAYHHSNVLHTSEEMEVLQREGDQTLILELQGLIFFGTANKLLHQIRDRIQDDSQKPVHCVVLDFRLVSGLDSSAVISFTKLKQIAKQKHLSLVFTTLSATAQQRLQQGGCLEDNDHICQVFPDLDRGLEWCERQLLATSDLAEQQVRSLPEHLKDEFSDPDQVDRLMTYLKIRELDAGEYLFQQGDPFDGLYFVESGQVSVVQDLGDGQTKRLRTYTTGTTIGEMGLYRKTQRMASVIADKPSTMYFLPAEAFSQIETADPLLASNIHRFIVNLLAERLSHREQELKNLLRSS